MILKSLKLENIRSYTNQIIEFPLGTTLFEGDIGSGKSTILMAIEFALFGLGSEKGAALLRIGEKKGSVTLNFEVEGEGYEVYRCLERKGSSVQQSECYIKSKEGILRFSASELKEKILEILKFNEPPDPKAQSLIYRYAVFTPQEEMKAILWMKPDYRLQTLRKAFRIEDYRIAMDNSQIIVRSIRDKIIELTSHASDLQEKKEAYKMKNMEIESCKKRLENLEKRKDELEEKLNRLKEEYDVLQSRKEVLGKAVGEIPLIEKQIRKKRDEISELEDEINKLEEEYQDKLQPAIEKLNKIKKPTIKSEKELKKELEELRKKRDKLVERRSTIQTKIDDYESIEKNKICPTCDRPADPKEFGEKIKQKMREKEKVSKAIKNCEEKIKKLEMLQDSLKEYYRMQVRLDTLKEKLKSNTDQKKKNLERIKILKSEVQEDGKRLEKAKADFEAFKQASEQAKSCYMELNKVRSEFENLSKNMASIQTTLKMLEKDVEELSVEIKAKEKEISLSEELKEYRIWFEEFFIPTLSTIEKHVLLSINQEFNQHFQKWWNLLIEDPSKESRVDEDFTPIVEQDGYEQVIDYLSGGEKTSLALAYRLALNSIVQKVSVGIKSNLLILDEPTDGFSKGQLFKIREILNEIKCPQVIIVSHEKELESFADQVFRVEKKEGISQISF